MHAILSILNQMKESDLSGSRLICVRTIHAVGPLQGFRKARSRRRPRLYHAECAPRISLGTALLQVKRIT